MFCVRCLSRKALRQNGGKKPPVKKGESRVGNAGYKEELGKGEKSHGGVRTIDTEIAGRETRKVGRGFA